MAERQFENVVDSRQGTSRGSKDRGAHEFAFATQPGALDRLVPRAPDGVGAQAHASPTNRALASPSPRAPQSLLRLQRQYGNRYVQRVLARASQEGEGAEVSPEVESSIERARGGGQALDAGVRVQMESAFGADFGAVRAHTDAEAHSLNQAVNAVAFTTGKDIFFREGAYGPSTSGGRELLAHELTHVVQQTGPGIKTKLSVSQPGDPLERQADEMARAVMSDEQKGLQRQAEMPKNEEEKKKKLHTKAESDGVQCQPEASKEEDGKKKLKRQSVGAMIAGTSFGMGNPTGIIYRQAALPTGPPGTVPPGQVFQAGVIRIVPRAQCFLNGNQGPLMPISDPNQALGLGNVTNGDRGFIRFVVDSDWDFENPGLGVEPARGRAQLQTTTPFRVPKGELKDEDDKLKFGKTRPTLQFSEGTGAAMDKQPTTSEDPDDVGGSVTVAPSITYQVQTAKQVQGGFNVTVLVLSEGANVAEQVALNETELISRAYTAELKYQPKQPPKPAPTKTLKRFAMTAEFGVDQRDPLPGDLGLLQLWWDGQAGLQPLPNDEARQAVRSGQTEVSVVGHASRTGSRAYNLVLAKDRADHIAKFLAGDDMMGSKAQMDVSSAGFDAAAAAGEARSERYVAVYFEALVTDDSSPTARGGGEQSSAGAEQNAV
ncbi:MAG TPA: DUF4157 domain-containing protein [Terriglobia bacterium]|nr:DUF4157 domain-containing protein [Terriglobia bacterium]